MQSADAAAETDGEPISVDGVVLAEAEARVQPGLLRGDQPDLRRAVEPASLHAVDLLGRVDGAAAGDPDGERFRPVFGDCLLYTSRCV